MRVWVDRHTSQHLTLIRPLTRRLATNQPPATRTPLRLRLQPVPYTRLTLPTILLVSFHGF